MTKKENTNQLKKNTLMTKKNDEIDEVIILLKEIKDLLETRLKKPIDTSIFHSKD